MKTVHEKADESKNIAIAERRRLHPASRRC